MKYIKWTLVTLLIVVTIFFVFVFASQGKTFEAEYPDIHATTDSATLARGEYLIYGPAHCSGCHSPLDKQMALSTGDHIPLEGGFVFNLPIGTMYTPNITPDETGIGNFSDPELARSLRYGVGKDGRALFDFMPFHNLSDEDLTAVISYLRVQPPVSKTNPKTSLNMLGKIVYATMIKPVGPDAGVAIPKSIHPDTTARYGEYLANYVANCRGCHTNRDLKTGEYIGEFYAGGFEMPSMIQAGKAVVTPNLTPHAETGKIYGWSQEKFIQRIRQGRIVPLSEMPWDQFNQMTDNDIKAIYAYLQTLKPIDNEVKGLVLDLK